LPHSLIHAVPGSSQANSLATLAEIKHYLSYSMLDLTAWEDLEVPEQENCAIIMAYAMRNLNWRGYKCYKYQAMPFPRWFEDAEDFTIGTAEFPEDVKIAQALGTVDIIVRGLAGRTSPGAGAAGDAIKSLSLFGDISISFGNQTNVPLRDGLSLSGLMQAGHFEIYERLAPYVVEIGFGGSWKEAPELLDPVLPTE
jgi:hypothetical protein